MSGPPPAAPTNRPDPLQDRPVAAGDGPRGTGFLLGLVRKLIDYGKQLAAALQQPAPATDPPAAPRFAGPIDIGLLLARIASGLQRAAALEARLLRRARGEETETPAPTRAATSPRPPRATQPAPRRPAEDADPRLPTAEQIAAQVRRRPIGAVIADICRDLGIDPSNPLWRQLRRAVVANGGSLTALVKGVLERRGLWKTDPLAFALPLPPAGPAIAASSTGPP